MSTRPDIEEGVDQANAVTLARLHRYAVVVDPYSSGSLFAAAFAAAGCEVIAVLSSPEPPNVYAASYRQEDFAHIFIASADELEKLANKLREFGPICVLTGCESGVELAEQLAPLVLPERSNTLSLALARRDKGLMAAAALDAGVPMMKQICTPSFTDVLRWVANNDLRGADLVIKPPKSASTDGVTKLTAGTGLGQAFFHLLDQPNQLGIVNDKVLVQEYLSGTEYVVDSFSYGGVHSICDVCRYTKIENHNGMAIYDRMDWLSADEPVVDLLESYAHQVLDALGISWGNAHIEIMLTDAGPRLIELGARPHGGGHPRLSQLATGDSQVQRSINFFIKNIIPARRYDLLTHMTVVFFRVAKPSVVRNVDALHSLSSLVSYLDASINVKEAQPVPATQDLFATLALGFVVLANVDQAQLERDVNAVRSAEKIVFQAH